jgi:predicted metal-binding membrane protein
MTPMAMTPMAMSPTLPGSVAMMTAMMMPSAIPVLAHRATGDGRPYGAPLFAGVYLGIWALVGIAMWQLYQQPGAILAGALILGAGLYELTPLKRDCRRRCLERGRSGLRFSVNCLGSSIGLMLALVAIDVMSVPLMCAVAAVALMQKLVPPHRAVDVPLALAMVAVGTAIAAT